MRRSSVAAIAMLAIALAATGAEAKLDLYVDKSRQQISVIQNGSLLYVWPVSTGRDRFSTPTGVYAPERLERSWFSKAYYNAPMPHAIFFHNGYAIHGSYDIAQLGGPASHGCVRLHPQAAALLFAMVEQEGPGNTTITIDGDDAPGQWPPRYRDWDDASRPPYNPPTSVYGNAAAARLPRAPTPKPAPYYSPDSYAGRPERQRDNAQAAMRGPYPVYRVPAPRRDVEAPVDAAPGPRISSRLPTAAKAASKCPACAPNREPDVPADRRVNVNDTFKNPGEVAKKPSETVKSTPPAPPPAEPQQPNLGYKILPKSYWAGASWRWRMKSDQEVQ